MSAFPIIQELRAARQAGGLTLEQLAGMADCATNSIATAEIGNRIPRLDTLIAWAEALGFDVVLRRRA